VSPDAAETALLLERARGGDRDAVDELLTRHRDLVRRFIELRLDDGLRRRLDASDVLQEAQLEIARRLTDYLERQPMPYHLWVRKTAYQNLLRLRRQHYGAECRDAGREQGLPESSSFLLARKLQGDSGDDPARAILDKELAERVRDALSELGETDQEVLLLRFFDGLSTIEVAQVLELEPAAARKRYGRALLRLRQALRGEEESS
jgi:RNA polymerase sigma-70 factor (ECF subfamily)